MRALLISTLVYIFINSISYAGEYDDQQFISDWSSPFSYEKPKKILLIGSLLTGALVATKSSTIDPVQKYMSTHTPLGDYSHYGDLSGQMIPNIIYFSYNGYISYATGSEQASIRSQKMLKASMFSGLSVFFLKRIFNQRRPNKGDRNSFPSGHTTTAFAFASTVALEHSQWSYPAYALATFVGLSRMNDNAHYLHDVVMGAAIGTAFGYAINESYLRANNSDFDFSYSPIKDGHYIGLIYKFN